MYRLILNNNKIIVYDKTDKEFRIAYCNDNSSHEQIGVVKESDNISPLVERMKKQYKVTEVVYDCHIKKKMGWKYFSEELKAYCRAKWSATRANRPLSDFQKKRISEGRIGKRNNHQGHFHSQNTKNIMSLRAQGHKRLVGRRWCHDPVTGKEQLVKELPEGYLLGRNPDLNVASSFKNVKSKVAR